MLSSLLSEKKERQLENLINVMSLAYLGDSIYEVYIREHLINGGIYNSQKKLIFDVSELTDATRFIIAVPADSTRSGLVNAIILTSLSANVTKEYKELDAIENKELAVKFQVKKAPTLFVPTEDGYNVYDNVSDIKKFIEGLK